MNDILFINGSPHTNGHTAQLAKALLQGKTYGQQFTDDQYEEVMQAMNSHRIIVIGSPLYWHSMSGAVRTMLDRAYGVLKNGQFVGKKLFFLFQGAAPTPEQLAAGSYTMSRFAALYGMDYQGMASNPREAAALAAHI